MNRGEATPGKQIKSYQRLHQEVMENTAQAAAQAAAQEEVANMLDAAHSNACQIAMGAITDRLDSDAKESLKLCYMQLRENALNTALKYHDKIDNPRFHLNWLHQKIYFEKKALKKVKEKLIQNPKDEQLKEKKQNSSPTLKMTKQSSKG